MDNPSVNGKSNKICKYFATNGHCFYGENCQFVHAKGKVESPLSGKVEETYLHRWLCIFCFVLIVMKERPVWKMWHQHISFHNVNGTLVPCTCPESLVFRPWQFSTRSWVCKGPFYSSIKFLAYCSIANLRYASEESWDPSIVFLQSEIYGMLQALFSFAAPFFSSYFFGQFILISIHFN